MNVTRPNAATAPPKKTYSFRPGYHARGLDATEVALELERLGSASGGDLTPEAVVAAASHPSSPLHAGFVWDDTEAARLYRLNEARRMLRAIEVRYLDRTPIPVYVHVPRPAQSEDADARGVYATMVSVASNVDLFTRTMVELKGKVASLRKSIDQLMDLAHSESRKKTARAMRRHLDALERDAESAD